MSYPLTDGSMGFTNPEHLFQQALRSVRDPHFELRHTLEEGRFGDAMALLGEVTRRDALKREAIHQYAPPARDRGRHGA